MNKYFQHFKTICIHKYHVGKVLISYGYFWQGIMHDMSKFSPVEFLSSAKYYTGTRSPIDNEKEDIGYSNAWLHHKGRNKHHWQYWTDFENDKCVPNQIPYNYLFEMAADIIGASKAYLKDNYYVEYPIEYFEANEYKWFMTSDDKSRLKSIMRLILSNFTKIK